MKLFYHHVGKAGAAADFQKTVFTDLPITLVENHLPQNFPFREDFLQDLSNNFTTGFFNCWGVPSGASRVITNLEVGDAVLLVETTDSGGAIPALCIVKSYQHESLPELSHVLWGSDHFPYIFFFSTEELSLTWGDFVTHLDYKPNYDPRGSFLSIANSRITTFSGAQGYVDFLRQTYSTKPPIVYSVTSGKSVKELPGESNEYSVEVGKEMEKLVTEAMKNRPELTSGQGKIAKQTMSSPRDEAFRRDVRRLYGSRCAICGIGLVSPDGKYEVQSAHIYPKERDGKDDVRNGICLCRSHHWAFDAGWISLNDELTIIVKENLPTTSEYDFIRRYDGMKITKPIRDELAPHPLYLQAHRSLHNFE